MQNEQWWATGDLFEGCNCELLCPCHVSFRQKPTHGRCEAVWAVHIEEGQYSTTLLNGLMVLVAVHCPGPTMIDGNWTAVLYIDNQATPPQGEALFSIFSGAAGGPWARLGALFASGKFKTVKQVPIQFTKERRMRSIKILDRVALEVEAIRGTDREAEVKLINLYNVIHGSEHVLARSSHRVNDEGLLWDNSGKHGIYSRFRWSAA